MKKLLIVVLFLPAVMMAQVQKVMIRTTGSIKQVNGEPVSGVLVKSIGETNKAISNKHGKLSLQVSVTQEGQAYRLLSVIKKGYELNDPLLIGRPLAYSSKIPLEIIMISSKELNRIKTEIEEQINQQVQKKYSAALTSLNDSLNNELISLERFREQVDFLTKQRDLFDPLVNTMADHYAHTDFAKLDSTDLKICYLIMEGDIEQADILLSEKGNISDRIAAIQRQKELYGQADVLVDKLKKSLSEQRKAYEKERDDIANDLYHKHAIALANFKPYEAEEYLTLRAELDETNIEYQLDAGAFELDYAANFEKASVYYVRALTMSEQQYGHRSEMSSYCLNHLGGLRLQESNFSEAMELRREALKIRKEIFGEYDTRVAACYNNIANIFYSMEKYEEGLACIDSAIYIYSHNEDTNLSDLASAYTTKGGLEIAMGHLMDALQYYKQSVNITDSIFGIENTHSATTINDIGIIKDYLGEKEEAMQYYTRALNLYKKIYGEKHPYVATVYSNMGTLYQDMGKLDSAMICLNMALDMRLDIFGELHEDIAISLNNLGSLCSAMKQYELAIDFYGKALSVIDVISGNNTRRFAITLGNIAIVYYRQQNWLNAIDYFDAALQIYSQYPEYSEQEISSLVQLEAKCYETIITGNYLSKEGREEALKDYQQLKDTYKKYLIE